MSSYLESLAMVAPAVIVGGLSLYFLFIVWRWVLAEERPLLLGEMMSRCGVAGPAVVSHVQARACAVAARRCFGCVAQGACRQWLDSGRTAGYREFCPNSGFIDYMRRENAG